MRYNYLPNSSAFQFNPTDTPTLRKLLKRARVESSGIFFLSGKCLWDHSGVFRLCPKNGFSACVRKNTTCVLCFGSAFGVWVYYVPTYPAMPWYLSTRGSWKVLFLGTTDWLPKCMTTVPFQSYAPTAPSIRPAYRQSATSIIIIMYNKYLIHLLFFLLYTTACIFNATNYIHKHILYLWDKLYSFVFYLVHKLISL